MARTNTDKIEELIRAAERHGSEIEAIRREIATLRSQMAELERGTNRLSVVEHQTADLQKSRDAWGSRIWAAVVAVVCVVIGYLLKR